MAYGNTDIQSVLQFVMKDFTLFLIGTPFILSKTVNLISKIVLLKTVYSHVNHYKTGSRGIRSVFRKSN